MKRKLVRDLIPQIAQDSGSDNKFRKYESDSEYRKGLADKIIEEANEVCVELNHRSDPFKHQELLPILEEMCDLLEVLDTCAYINNLPSSEETMKMLNIDPMALLYKYDAFHNGDFVSLFNSTKFSLYHTFLNSLEFDFEVEFINICSIILSYITLFDISIETFKEIQYDKQLKRGGFDDMMYMIL